jgi:hypothetical protein
MTTRTYYWEHPTDESRFLRSASAREMAAVAHAAAGGEVGVILDDGGGLTVRAVKIGETVDETVRRLEAIGVASVIARHEERPDEGTGWYVYANGQDAGGPFETEDEALEHWSR